MSRKIVIVGAGSRIAECCARLWAAQGAHILLAGRDAEKLGRIAADLRVRSNDSSSIDCCHFDALDPQAPELLLAKALGRLGSVDLLLIAHGLLPEQDAGQANLALARKALEINGVSACLVAEAFAGYFESRAAGCIAAIGSVAGDRGRQSNYLYGAAKGLLERYLQGLRNRLYRAGVRVVLIKPGPTDTPMTAAMTGERIRLAAPEDVAADIVYGIERGRSVIYTPARWRWIMWIIRCIPESIFVRLRL